MTPLALELTRLIGKKGIKYIEGCQASSKECGRKNSEGKFICKHCRRWNGPDRQEIEYTPATLSDFHRYANDKHLTWQQNIDHIEYGGNYDDSGRLYGDALIPYDSSKEFLYQDEETLKQIVELIKSNQ